MAGTIEAPVDEGLSTPAEVGLDDPKVDALAALRAGLVEVEPPRDEDGSALGVGTAISKGAIVDSLKGDKFYKIWNTRTGLESTVHKNQLWTCVNDKKFSDPPFENAFTVIHPDEWPRLLSKPTPVDRSEKVRCALHQDGPDRPEYDKLGLPICNKANFPSQYWRERHMSSRHKSSKAAIDDIEKRARDKEDRALQQETLKAMQGISTNLTAPTPVAPSPPAAAKNHVPLLRDDVVHLSDRVNEDEATQPEAAKHGKGHKPPKRKRVTQPSIARTDLLKEDGTY